MKKLVLCMIFSIILVSCSSLPSEALIQTAIAQTSLAQPTETKTPKPTRTAAPTKTKSPTKTPSPTSTSTNTPTPEFGNFLNPLHIGDKMILDVFPTDILPPGEKNYATVEMELIDVKRSEEADKLAKQHMYWVSYIKPIEGQEYLAVYVKLKILEIKDMNKVETIYPYWSVTLRYSEDGYDTWSVDPILKFKEGYPPIEGEGWVFFLIKSSSKPYLYFQPYLMSMEQVGIRDIGVYFDLNTDK